MKKDPEFKNSLRKLVNGRKLRRSEEHERDHEERTRSINEKYGIRSEENEGKDNLR